MSTIKQKIKTPLTVSFTVYGEPASKANSRRLFIPKGQTKVIPIKSAKALAYVNVFGMQCPKLNPMLEGDLSVTMKVYYASRRPDLDESVILDCMQAIYRHIPIPGKKKKKKVLIQPRIYENDRQVREKHIFWGLDPNNPRAEITVDVIDD